MREFTINNDVEGIRLNKYIKKILPKISDSLLYKLIRKKYFELNDKKAEGNELLKSGDKLSIFLGEETFIKFSGEQEGKVEEGKSFFDKKVLERIFYEDDNIIIYDKEAGLLSQSVNANDKSVNSILNDYLKTKENYDISLYKPSVVNRLDRNTKGLIIFAKTYMAARLISQYINEGIIEKHYKALVNGAVTKEEEKLTNLYKKDENKNIAIIKNIDFANDGTYDIVKLIYTVIEKTNDTSLLDVNLITGKSHQIRAQLAHIGHPIVGDKKYMDAKLYKDNTVRLGKKTQELTCYMIKFPHIENEVLANLSEKIFIRKR